jgi:hypothetical protein
MAIQAAAAELVRAGIPEHAALARPALRRVDVVQHAHVVGYARHCATTVN